MTNKPILLLLLAMLSIFSACKDKTEPVDLCQNGFLDPGESGIDCGGNCSPCIPYEPASLYLEVNGIPMSSLSKELNYQDGTWSLVAFNDTLSFQFNLGSNGDLGTYPMSPLGTFATKNGESYMNSTNGTYAISAHNTQSKKMSGFLQVNFTNGISLDTIKVKNGQFEYMAY